MTRKQRRAASNAPAPGDKVGRLKARIRTHCGAGRTAEAARAWLDLATLHTGAGEHESAAEACRQSLALRPQFTDAWFQLGGLLLGLGRAKDAAAAYGQILAYQPDNAEAYHNISIVLHLFGRADHAAAACERALALQPDHTEAWLQLARIRQTSGNPAGAEAASRRAIAVAPGNAAAHLRLGLALVAQARPVEAETCFREALRLDPSSVEAKFNLGLAGLLRLDFEHGWEGYHWRWTMEGFTRRPFPQPEWRGQPLAGRRLLVWGEQGIGDEILMAGLVPELAARGASCIIECHPRLVPLLSRSLPGTEVVARSDPPDPRCQTAELQVPAFGVAAALRPRSGDFAPITPYLKADGMAVADLRRKYGGGEQVLVGISWTGGSSEAGRRKSVPLALWRPLLGIPGLRFVSLQYGDRQEEIAAARREFGCDLILDETVDPLADMDRAAAQIAAMDLVITIDNATAATASALGRPVWCMVARVPFWLMGIEGEATPWHPGMRLFRQPAPGDWASVVDRVAGELSRHQRSPQLCAAAGPDAARAEGDAAEGVAHFQAGRFPEAAAAFRRVAEARPDHGEAWMNLGAALNQAERADEAVAALERAAALEPETAEIQFNLGLALRKSGRLAEAEAATRRAIALRPGHAASWASLGRILHQRDRPEESEIAARQAIDLDPGFAIAHVQLGVALQRQGRLDESLAANRRALALAPDNAEAHFCIATAHLQRREFERAWPEYGWRWRTAGGSRRPFPQPEWRGEDLAGRRLLVWGEQGIGDEILFFGLVPELQARGARCVIECNTRLSALLSRSLPGVEVVARTDPPTPACLSAEWQVPAATVAALLRPDAGSFQPIRPYLRADAAATDALRRKYTVGDRPLVGICWASGESEEGRRKTLPLARWRAILSVPGVRFVSLQHGDRRAEIEEARRDTGCDLIVDEAVDPLADMDLAAAQIAAMDLVITIDNAAASTASALGQAVWCMATRVPFWLMGLEGDTTPWHHTMRLFRQSVRGEWDPVTTNVAEALRREVRDLHMARGSRYVTEGRADAAAEAFRDAISLDPGYGEGWSGLGSALAALGRIDEAVAAHRRAVDSMPGSARAHLALGLGLHAAGRFAEAADAFRSVVGIEPGNAAAWSNLGLCLNAKGRHVDAIGALLKAIDARPGNGGATYNLGIVLRDMGRIEDAAVTFRQAVEVTPDLVAAWSDLAIVAKQLGRTDETLAALARVAELAPGNATVWFNLGTELQAAGRHAEAAEALGRAVALEPDNVEAHGVLGITLRDAGRFDEAAAAYDRALALDPGHKYAAFNRAMLHLLRGEFAQGWPGYDLRWIVGRAGRCFPQQHWRGGPLDGQRLLVWGEQGLGDELIQFGLIPELTARGATCVVECDPRLVPLLARSLPGVEVVARADPPDPRLRAATLQVPLLGAAALLRPRREGFAAVQPYLRPDAATVAEMRRTYADGPRMLVGLSWWSRHALKGDSWSIPLAEWAPILQVPGVRFVSLQYGDRRDEVEAVCRQLGIDVVMDVSVDPLTDLDRAAAQVAAMDLVITIDNATSAMAAALGRPTWDLVSVSPYWLAGAEGETTPWLPTLRLFRQAGAGGWGDVVAKVAGCLRREVGQAQSKLGIGLYRAGRFEDAAIAFREAAEADPGNAESWANHGLCLRRLDRLGEAEAAQRRAIDLDPSCVEAHYNLGIVLRATRHLDEAEASFRRTLAIDPRHADGHAHLAYLHLQRGEFERGWPEYEWRWKTGRQTYRDFPGAPWRGEPVEGRSLLVWGEQGIGDQMLYFGLVPELLEQGVSCVVECEKRLVPLLRRSLPGVPVVARAQPPEAVCRSAELHVPVGTLAALLRPRREGFRPIRPYLRPDEAVVAELRRRYAEGGRMLVGISWTSGGSEEGRRKSLPLTRWLPILRVPGVRFVSLQYGDRSAEIAEIRSAAGIDILEDPTVNPLADMDRAAAQVAAMDLVVTIDNATGVTASALGRPVWCLLTLVPYWLMGLEGDTSVWHHGMRLFRQSADGEWDPVVARVAKDLADAARRRR